MESDSQALDPFAIARKTLEGLNFHEGEQEALALVAAILENYPYRPAQIYADRVPELWLFRIKELWTAPPGFREALLHHLLQEYQGTKYYELYRNAIQAAREAFQPGEPA